VQPVEQREYTCALLLGQLEQPFGDHGVGFQIAAAQPPEAGRVLGPVERRDDGVRQRS
jgi:hypothetical protein